MDTTTKSIDRPELQVHPFWRPTSLNKGLKKFGEAGKKAAVKEMKQLHDRSCFEPIKLENLTHTEKKRALELLIFLVEKRSGEIKARTPPIM